MPESKKKDKKTCRYRLAEYKCDRLALKDDKYCIFHSEDMKEKKSKFMEAFRKEYDSQIKKNEFIFTGFIFPLKADLKIYNFRADLKNGNRRTDLRWAKFHEADLEGVYLKKADLQNAELRGAKLKKAKLHDADLRGADLKNAEFEKTKVFRVKVNRKTEFMGIDVTRAVGSPHFVRFAKDHEFLEELQETKRGRIIYHIWNVLADCGRSMWKWVLWCLFVVFLFAIIYTPSPEWFPDWWIDLCEKIGPQFEQTSEAFSEQSPGFWSLLYFSIVTFTTLGFGDIVAANITGRILVALEVIMGYIMLGLLIGIAINKFARKS